MKASFIIILEAQGLSEQDSPPPSHFIGKKE